MTEPDLLALARELETADGGSVALDIKIALAAAPFPRRVKLWLSLEAGVPAHCDYTRSIDAALTLAPPATPWQVSTSSGPEARVGAHEGRARTAALAVAAAALRARVAAGGGPASHHA